MESLLSISTNFFLSGAFSSGYNSVHKLVKSSMPAFFCEASKENAGSLSCASVSCGNQFQPGGCNINNTEKDRFFV
jgi:hypothetical protein